MVSTTIIFDGENVQPPVYVAGTFTDWVPVEMRCKTTEDKGASKHFFSYEAEVEPGDYQYKFRLGPGDWWVLDDSNPTANDGHGNVNNVLSVKSDSFPSPEEPIKNIPEPAQVLNTKDAYIVEDEPEYHSVLPQESAEAYPPAQEIVPDFLRSRETEQVEQSAEQPKVVDVKHIHFDEHTGKMTGSILTTRKDSIPEFAPPPYSAAANGSITAADPHAALVADDALEKLTTETFVATSQSETKQKSLIARLYSGNGLVMAVAMVAVPVAVSYYLRR